MKRVHTTAMLIVFVVLSSGRAAAEDAVLESYSGPRPDNAETILAPLHDELGSRGYMLGASLTERIERDVSRSGDRASATEIARLQSLLERADEAFIRGEWQETIEAAGRGLEILRATPAVLAGNEQIRRQYRHGLILIAESQRRLGNAREATEAMAEMIRAFPTHDISSSRYSPAVTRFFNQTRRDLEKLGKGTLVIKVADPATVIFVDERYVGAGRVSLELIPGTYRVLTRKGSDDGRIHVVRVEPGHDVTLSLSWPLDATLIARGDYVGLEHPSEAARVEDEARIAITVARKIDAGGVVVIGIREYEGRRSIVGQVLSLDSGKALRTGTLAIEPVAPRAETVRNLARYLAGENVEGFEPGRPAEENNNEIASLPRDDTSSWARDPIGWTLTGVGVAGAVVGLGLLANAASLDNDANTEPVQSRQLALRDDADRRRLGGALTAAAGGALLIGGIVALVVNPDRERESSSAWLIVGPRGVALGGSF